MKIHIFIAHFNEGIALLRWRWRHPPSQKHQHDPLYVWVKRVGRPTSAPWLRISEPLNYHGKAGRPIRVTLQPGEWRLALAHHSPGSTKGRVALSNELQFKVEQDD